MSWKRKLLLGFVGLLAILLIAVVALWITKPWVPEVELTDPGSTGERVVERGLFANYFPAKSGSRGPAVLLLGGSEGGIGSGHTRQAVALQASGFSVLTPAYFGAPGQPKNLELVALETFDRALAWLRSRPEVDSERMAVVGHSKGAEAALLVATRHPELRAVVASAPSSFVWPGINWGRLKAQSSWSSSGRPLPVLPYGPLSLSALFGDLGRLYEGGLKRISEHARAAIPVEKLNAPVLLVCGEADSLWPACTMARQVRTRAADRGGPTVRVLEYERAGHRVFGPPLSAEDPDFGSLGRWGGSAAANNAARTDAWPKVVEFLRSQLGMSEAA